MATAREQFVRVGLLTHRVLLQFLLESKAGGNRTPNIQPQRRGRDGKASKTGTAANWPRNIPSGRAPFMRLVIQPLTMGSATAGGAGGYLRKAGTGGQAGFLFNDW